MSHVTVPPVPAGHRPAACWRKTVTALDTTQSGARAVLGQWLAAGDEVELLHGTLVVACDKTTRYWDQAYLTGESYAVEDATVTVYLAGPGGLTELWQRYYKTAKSAFATATRKKLASLIEDHPPPGGEIIVLNEARRPNVSPGRCRWCGSWVPAKLGHRIDRGEEIVEHYQRCPERRASTGARCADCGVTVTATNAHERLVREGQGRWETRHNASLDCTVSTPPSAEAIAETKRVERLEREQQDRAKAQRREQAAARRRAKADAERAAAAAEAERIQGLAVVGIRGRDELYDKGIQPGWRMRLVEVIFDLSDGTTTTQWQIETYQYVQSGPGAWIGEGAPTPGENSVHRTKAAARATYQQYQWSVPTPAPPSPRRTTGSVCPTSGDQHCDNCGTRHPQDGWMWASLGIACGVDCYDAMADAPGAHARRYHRR